MTTSDTVAAQVLAQVKDARVRLAMLLGAGLEGGSLGGPGSFGVGDHGNSHGPFQINLPFHPNISQAGAEDPATAVAYMLPAYTSAVHKISAGLWSSNPEKAAEQAAFIAENPAQDYYVARGAAAVDHAYSGAVHALSGAGGQTLVDPPAPYDVHQGKSGYYDVTVGKTTYSQVDKSVSNALKIPVTIIKQMAAYLVSLGPSNGRNYNQGIAKKVAAGDTSSKDLLAVVIGYTHTVKPPPTASPLPGSGAIGDALNLPAWFSPIKTFIANGALVVLGVIAILVAVVILAKSDQSSSSTPAPAPARSSTAGEDAAAAAE